jgi:predicted pyridoxine 5'-phosphate oxidase superfamily flavin-nucleotide-binding protein
MPSRFAQIAFTPHAQALQERFGSRRAYARRMAEAGPAETLGPQEREFIESRDSFYLATVSATGWPYVQHRGGPKGFLRVLDERTIGFADLAGNKQFISVGNLETNDRVALFLMDYPSQSRLKILAHAHIVEAAEDAELLESLTVPSYDPRIERGIVFAVEGFDWNCQQHITPRYTLEELGELGLAAGTLSN